MQKITKLALFLVFTMAIILSLSSCNLQLDGILGGIPGLDGILGGIPGLGGNKCEHAETEWKIDKNATCTEAGSKHLECTSCEEILETKVIEKTAHTEKIISSVAATCTTTGLTEGKVCSLCSTVLLEQSVVPTIPHTEKIVNGKNPTCTETGLSDGKICSKCNTVLLEQQIIDMLDHTEETVAGKKATCTEEGLTDGKKCTVCNTVLLEQVTISIKDHTESEWIIDKNAEIGVDGSKHKECLVCKKPLKTEIIPAIVETHVHKGNEWVTVTPATCTTTGVKHLVCECGQKMDEAVIEVAPHTEETVAGKKATCTETGLTDGKKCAVCGETLLAQTVTDKIDHTAQTIPGIASTCTQNGLTDGKKCSVCNKILVAQVATAKAAHTEQTLLSVAPTCTESGLTEGKKCSVCTTIITSQQVIPPTGHSFTNGTCTGCGIGEPYGLWIIDGQGNPVSNIIVKVMQNGEQVKMYPYNGEFLSMPLDTGSYEIELDLSNLSGNYTFDASLCALTPSNRTATIRLFKTVSEEPDTTFFVGYPVELDYNAYYVGVGSTLVPLTPNDYSYFVFSPSAAAIYTITYECDAELAIEYRGTSHFPQGADRSEESEDISKYENGLALSVYASNLGNDYVIAVKSTGATSCILNIKNAGDPGTRIEDEPWTPYLEDEAKVEEQLNMDVSGRYTTIDLTDLTVKAVYNEDDGYYHLGTADGPIIFIDLTSSSQFTNFSIQTICGNQRMGTYVYDENGKIVEKRSYNELFIQYGMPDNADATVDSPIRVALTAKLAEAIQSFGNRNGWWDPDSDSNLFTASLLGAPYNQEYAWLLFCGYYA